MKLYTVLSVAFGAEILPGTGSSSDHLAPSSVFELPKIKGVRDIVSINIGKLTHPVSTETRANLPADNALTGLSCINVPSIMGPNKYRVNGQAAAVNCPARIRASLGADRRHCNVSAPLFSQPLNKKD